MRRSGWLLLAVAVLLDVGRAFRLAGAELRARPLPALRAPRTVAPTCIDGRPTTTLEDDLKAAERAETIDYFKTLGGFSFGSLGLFVAFTAGAGLDDVVAGNLVLVLLCVYGAYLLFFDGGVTQAALESQALQQLAEEEGDIMATAPRADVKTFDASLTRAEPDAVAAVLRDEGFARVSGALSPETAGAMLDFVNDELEVKRAEAKEDALKADQTFGDVLMRENRYDMMLPLEAAPVKAALAEVLERLAPALEEVLGDDAELFELAALVSDPRSPRQPMHPDTPYREGEGAAILTAFVALQDVTEDMGPTALIPGSITADAHERFNSRDDGGRERVALLREAPNHVGSLSVGDVNIIDSRLIHAGGANGSSKRRVLFYVSFRRRGARTPTGSLLYKLRREGFALNNRAEWARAS